MLQDLMTFALLFTLALMAFPFVVIAFYVWVMLVLKGLEKALDYLNIDLQDLL